MTIAQAFNEIAVAQGGTASKSGSITDAIDALNDALAGSDQASAQTIEQAVRLLGENIGSGGGGGDAVKAYIMPEASFDQEVGDYYAYDATCVTMAVGEANCSVSIDSESLKLRIVTGADLESWGVPSDPTCYEQVAYTSNDDGTYTFTVPALDEGDALYIIWFYADVDPFS